MSRHENKHELLFINLSVVVGRRFSNAATLPIRTDNDNYSNLMLNRILYFSILIVSFNSKVICQTKSIILYETSFNQSDTTVFLTVEKNSNGVTFAFPLKEAQPFYTLKSDSTFERHLIPANQPTYGPYRFKRTATKILFRDKSISKKYRDLYKLSFKEHSSPDLFSSSTDSYNILTTLIDSNASLPITNQKVPCFKFFQILTGHNPVFEKHFRLLYIDKNNLLPCRIENYSDKECSKLERVAFMRSYIEL